MADVINVLLIEDDEDDYFLTSDYLAQCDSPSFNLTWVTNSEDAIAKLKKHRFDLCLLDYLLGAENAIDVMANLKANQFNLPVVILTGQSDVTVDEMVMRAGAADYLQKSEIETPRFMRTIRYAMVRRDIENERLERDKIEQKNKAKDKFLAHLGHELRTPLTSILGYTELLIDDVRNSNFKQELSIIQSNGRHLLSLLNDLLDMSRIMANKLDLNVKAVNVCAFLTDIHSLMLLSAKDKGLSLDIVAATPIPEFIDTDPTRLRQVLLNLISNAVKFTDKGSITLTIEFAEANGIDNKPAQLRFHVSDTGVGMPPNKLANIFQPFEQIEDVMRANHGGAGLGLAICKELVQKLGGDISVTSRLGEGSTFSFDINPGDVEDQPKTELQLGQVQQAQAASINLSVTGKVLIVDDLKEIRRLTGHIVGQSQAEISYAENGVKALEAVLMAEEQNQPFNLVLMDIHMPVMNGIEALHAMRRHGQQTPVIAVTAASRKGLRESLIQEGFNDVIGKPIDRFALTSLLGKYLPSSLSKDIQSGESTETTQVPTSLPSETTRAEVNERQAVTSNNGKHVLVIEDDSDAAELLQLFISHLGHTVTVETSGSEALHAASNQQFDHVLMDLTLPDYNGYDLAKELKTAQPSARITIVSGHEADAQIMSEIGIDNALLKPVTKDDLESIIC